jgi:hypothetical protein
MPPADSATISVMDRDNNDQKQPEGAIQSHPFPPTNMWPPPPPDPQALAQAQAQVQAQANGANGEPQGPSYIMPYPPGMVYQYPPPAPKEQPRPKRRQVKMAVCRPIRN